MSLKRQVSQQNELAWQTGALLQLKACNWRGDARPLRGHVELPAPEELGEFLEGRTEWFSAVYPTDLESVKRGVSLVMRGLDSAPLEYRMVAENSGIVWVRHWFFDPLARDSSDHGQLAGFVQVLDERKRLEAECLRVCEREKAVIGQELHDDVCQLLAGVACMLEVVSQKAKTAMPDMVPLLVDLGAQLNAGMDRTRSLAHSLVPLRLVTMGLPSALRELAAQTERNFKIKVNVRLPRTIPAQPPEYILQLYRIAQEAISNGVKHGKATEIGLQLSREREKMVLVIADNGSGIPTELNRREGIGLHIMRYRAGAIGGQISFSSAPVKGTTVAVRFDEGSPSARSKGISK